MGLLNILATELYKVNAKPLPHIPTGPDRIQLILTVVFTVIGALCVLFVTIGGFRYVAAQGEPKSAAQAKGTIMYALVGLLISISAVAIVTFVMGQL